MAWLSIPLCHHSTCAIDPVLPFRGGGKFTFPLCRTCVDAALTLPSAVQSSLPPHEQSTSYRSERDLVSPRIPGSCGLKIGHRSKCANGHFPRKMTDSLNNYVNFFLKIKQEAYGWHLVVRNDPLRRQTSNVKRYGWTNRRRALEIARWPKYCSTVSGAHLINNRTNAKWKPVSLRIQPPLAAPTAWGVRMLRVCHPQPSSRTVARLFAGFLQNTPGRLRDVRD